MVSRALGNINPFSERVLELNSAQISFILRMYAEDHPNEYKIVEQDLIDGTAKTQIFIAWSNRLTGKVKEEFDKNPILYLKKYYSWSK
jgi:hypothetical protein